MIASLTKTTLKQYNSGLKLWWVFCVRNNWNIYTKSIPMVLKFLGDQYEKGASYGTLNCIRSALALILSPDLGTDYQIKRFFKGVQHLRPNCPRYNCIWDPSTVLRYLSLLFPNENISLELLTQKLATLLALITAHRVQTLSLIEIGNIFKKPEGFDILISQRIKTSGIGRLQPVLHIPFFTEKPSLCAANTLQAYLTKTLLLRNQEHKKLFITTKKPYREATSQSISRWIKTTLEKSGIDVRKFSAAVQDTLQRRQHIGKG